MGADLADKWDDDDRQFLEEKRSQLLSVCSKAIEINSPLTVILGHRGVA